MKRMDFPPFVNVTEEFLNGYQVGLGRYRLDCARCTLTEAIITATLQRLLMDGQHLERYRAGMLAGWFAGLYVQTPPATVPASMVYPAVRFIRTLRDSSASKLHALGEDAQRGRIRAVPRQRIEQLLTQSAGEPAVKTDIVHVTDAEEAHHHQPSTWTSKSHHMVPLLEAYTLSQQPRTLEREDEYGNNNTTH